MSEFNVNDLPKNIYLLKYWMEYYLNIDELGEVTICTEIKALDNPNLRFDIRVYDDEKKYLTILTPKCFADNLIMKFPDIFIKKEENAYNIQLIFLEENLKKYAEYLKIKLKDFPPDAELIKRFINYHQKKVEDRKKRRAKKKHYENENQ